MQNFEVYTNGPNNGSAPTYPAGDILLTLDLNYSSTTNGVSAYAGYQLPYASAFAQFLAAASVSGGGGSGASRFVMGGAAH